MPRTAGLPPDLREKYTEELEELLDEHEEITAKRKRINKALGGELSMIADSIYQVRRRLKGVGGEQLEIEGTEIGERRRDPAVASILKAAERVRDHEEKRRRHTEEGEEDPDA